MSELWTTTEVAEHIGASTVKSASRSLGRWGIKPVSRQPGRSGENLWDAEQVRQAKAARPGRGARTDLKDTDPN